MQELDLLLLRYLRAGLGKTSSIERTVFAQFLELPDPDLVRYLIGGDVPNDPAHAALCRAILAAH